MIAPVDATAPLARSALLLERRAFLRLAGTLVAAGCVPSGCGGVPARWRPLPGAPLAVLTPRAYATFTAAAARIVGPTGEAMIERRDVDVGRAADALLARTPALSAPLAQALAVLEWGVWPLVRKVRPFTSLDGAARDAVLDELMRSRVALKRQLFGGVRALALLAFYGTRESRAISGYPGPFGSGRVSIGDAMIGAGDAW